MSTDNHGEKQKREEINWNRKISALLHDSLDKSLCLIVRVPGGHEEHASEIAKKLIKGFPKREDVSWADWNASAANRGLIPTHSVVNVLAFQNPFSAYIEEVKRLDSNLQNILKSQVRENFKAIATYKSDALKEVFNKVFRNLIREYYQVYERAYPDLKYLVFILSEDTRFPDSPIFSHLSMTSALSATGQNFYLLFFDIGGIHPFVSAGRKTKDFYAGSLIISLLSLVIIQWIAKTWGPDHILSPSILEVPLAQLIVFGEKIDWRDLIPVIPATVTAIIPKSKSIDEIRESIRKELKGFWGKIVRRYIEDLKNIVSKKNIADKEIEKYLAFENVFPKIRILTLPVKAIGKGQESRLLIGENTSSNLEIVKCLREVGLWDKICRIRGTEYSYQPLSEFEVLIKILQLGSGYIKYHDEVMRIPETGGEPNKAKKCMACGERNIAFPDKSPAWKKLEEEPIVDLGERLCHLCLLKRMFPKYIFKNINNGKIQGTVNIPSTDDFSVTWFKVSLLALGIAALDLSDENFKNFKEFYNCFYNPSTKTGIWESIAKDLQKELAKEKILAQIPEPEKLNIMEMSSSRLLTELYRRLKNKLEEKKHRIQALKDVSIDCFLNQLNYMLVVSPELFFETAIDDLIKTWKKRKEHKTDAKEKHLGDLAKKHIENLTAFYNNIKRFVMEKKNLNIVNRAREEIIKVISDISGIDKELLCELLKPLSRIVELPEEDKTDYSFIPIAFRPLRRFVLLYGDGDNMGKWAIGGNLGPWILHHHPIMYKAILKLSMPKGYEKAILTRPKPISPSYMFTLSLTLSHGAILISRIIEAFGGFVIYSGGDDVLAFLPPEIWFITYYLIRVLFSKELGLNEVGRIYGRIEVFTYGMGWRATQSYGVVIAHPKADLRLVKKNVDELLEGFSKKLVYYKENYGDVTKDGLSVRYIGRAGIIDEAIGIPNVLLFDNQTREYISLKEFNRALHEKVKENVAQALPKAESKQDIDHLNAIENYQKEVKSILYESRASVIVSNTTIPQFIGILPKSPNFKARQKSEARLIISPALLAYNIIKYVLNNILSHTAKQKLRQFYESIREQGLKTSLLHLLRYELERKPGSVGQKLKDTLRDYVIIVTELFREIHNIENLFSVRSEDGNEAKESRIYPLADILFRVLRNTI